MTTPTILSKLCTICRTRSPKYECPRCGTKTCSVVCVKQHKKRSQCSGVRNPAAFIKKTKLATPQGFDHDYNYLTGVERAVDRAEREAADHGIGEDFAGDKRIKNRLSDLGIRLHRAPKGMTRHKENQTRWRHKQDCIRWSIEWIFPDDSRKLDSALETFSISAAYAEVQSAYTVGLRQQQKRENKAAQEQLRREAKRRKHRHPQDLDQTYVCDDLELQTILEANARHGVDEGQSTRTTGVSEIVSNNPTVGDDDCFAAGGLLDAAARDERAKAQVEDDSDVDIKVESSEQTGITNGTYKGPQIHFYLLRPFTRGTTKVLRVLDKDQSLGDTLRDRDVFEFPTIYALYQEPQSIAGVLELEEHYDTKTKSMAEEIDQELIAAGVDEDVLRSPERKIYKHEEPWNEANVLESLNRDVAL